MAISVKEAAKGNAAQTGAPGPTPAPKSKPTAPDLISQVRSPVTGGNRYGQNQFAGRSSLNPGETLISPMAASLKAAQDDGESVLDAVISRGAKMADSNFETRAEPATPYPAAHGMKHRTVNDGSPGDKV